MFLTIVIVLVVGLMAYVRLAPTDAEAWHKMPATPEVSDGMNSAMRSLPGGAETLARLSGIIAATPRTSVVAGSVEDGMITYVTRSALMGYPDYTTVKLDGDTVWIWARARFGKSDFGVNRKRLEGWFAALGQ